MIFSILRHCRACGRPFRVPSEGHRRRYCVTNCRVRQKKLRQRRRQRAASV